MENPTEEFNEIKYKMESTNPTLNNDENVKIIKLNPNNNELKKLDSLDNNFKNKNMTGGEVVSGSDVSGSDASGSDADGGDAYESDAVVCDDYGREDVGCDASCSDV